MRLFLFPQPARRFRWLLGAWAVLLVVVGGVVLAGHVADAALPPPQHDPQQVHQLADDIVARPEFQRGSEGVLTRLLHWIGDQLRGNSDGSSQDGGTAATGAGAGGGGSALLTIVLFAVTAAVLVFVAYSLRGRLGRRVRAKSDDVDVEVEPRRSIDEWEAEAQRHEAAGDWKEGLRCRFRSLVERLVKRGAIPDIPGRTAGELRADVDTSLPTAADDFAGAVDLFERAWYGDLPTGPDEAARFREHAERVLAGSSS